MDATEEIPLMLTNTSTTKEFPMKPVLVTKLSVTTTDYPVPVKSSAKTAPRKQYIRINYFFKYNIIIYNNNILPAKIILKIIII